MSSGTVQLQCLLIDFVRSTSENIKRVSTYWFCPKILKIQMQNFDLFIMKYRNQVN